MEAFLLLGIVLQEIWRENTTSGYTGGRQLLGKFVSRSFDLGFVQFNFDENGLIQEELSDMNPDT
ncbi:hypothetical protein RvY_16397 [Ramazzottius varieornatus]|uniref:Receptor ligand binding region domain-containing protein n=1 Tax=Ramazzottius varieornatus TaxID=947166 RepID=A0A1D1VYA9_RAMVA|nr:hypothetical protein RvY_16397 [Ramazzottius varieornatus]